MESIGGPGKTAEEDGIHLSQEEALIFVRQQLHLDIPDPLPSQDGQTLQSIVRQFGRLFAFSTLRYLGLPVEGRRLSTAAEVKERGLRMLGGTCYDSNVFLHFLLKALGYHLHFLIGKFYGSINEFHVFSVANLPSGQVCLVDASSVPPISEHLTDLNFQGDTSPSCSASLWHIRFRRCPPATSPEPHNTSVPAERGSGQRFLGTYKWIDGSDHSAGKAPVQEDGWGVFYEFTLHYKTFAELTQAMTIIYTNASELAPVLDHVVISRYPNGHLIMLRNATFIRDLGQGISTEERLTSLREIHDKIKEHFGDIIDDQDIQLAIDTSVKVAGLPSGIS